MRQNKIKGTEERPRISVRRSHKNIFAQLVNDVSRKTLFSLSTLHEEVKTNVPYGGNIKAAEKLGEVFARMARSKGFSRVVFDRDRYPYHGRIKAFAEALRKGGMEF
jgi:large subunit ribosomal protein L18